MKKINILNSLLLSIAVLHLSGCALQQQIASNVQMEADTAHGLTKTELTSTDTPFFQRVNTIYLADRLSKKPNRTLPAVFNKSVDTLPVQSLTDFATTITRLTGVQVDVAPEALIVAKATRQVGVASNDSNSSATGGGWSASARTLTTSATRWISFFINAKCKLQRF